jgi:hypothetical protein
MVASGGSAGTTSAQSGAQISGKESFDDPQAGYFLGIDKDGIAKFNLGNATKYIKWNGVTFVVAGAISVGSLDIPDTTTANSFHVDSLGNTWWGAAGIASATGKVLNTGAATFSNMTITGGAVSGWTSTSTSLTSVSGGNTTILSSGATSFSSGPTGSPTVTITQAGAITANSGTIGGFTLANGSMYGGIIKTAVTVGAGTTGVIMDTAGLRGYDSILGLTFNLPTNGSAPTFASGVINTTIFNVSTSGIIRTSATVGDGTANSAGILMNNTGFYACAINQTPATANVRILTDGSGYFAGTFEIGNAVKTIDAVGDIQTALNDVGASGGGTIWLKAGVYTLTADISIPSGVTLKGTSRDEVILDCNSSYSVKIAGTNVYSTGNVTIANGDTTVVGSGTTWTAGMVGRYILLDGIWYEILTRVDNTHITIDGYNGTDLTNSAYVLATVVFTTTLETVTVQNATGSGIIVQYANEPSLTNLGVLNCGTGIDMDYVVFPRILVSSDYNGVGLNMNFVEGYYIDYSEFNYSTGDGVVATDSGNSTFFNSSVVANAGNGVTLTNPYGTEFLSNDISINGAKGLEIVSGASDLQFIGSNFLNNISDGIKLDASSDSISITSCSITDNGGYGLNIAASSVNNTIITSSAFSSNTSGAINNLGIGTIIRGNSGTSDRGSFGDGGVDGPLTISSGTTNIDLAGASFLQKNYSSISITGTGALTFTNPHANGTRIIFKSMGDVTLTSSATPNIDLRNLGAAGGAGYDANHGSGGRGAGALLIECAGALNFTGTINATGTAGGDASQAAGTTRGGGGGGGGGTVWIIYNSLVSAAGTITATSGATGANGGGNIQGGTFAGANGTDSYGVFGKMAAGSGGLASPSVTTVSYYVNTSSTTAILSTKHAVLFPGAGGGGGGHNGVADYFRPGGTGAGLNLGVCLQNVYFA